MKRILRRGPRTGAARSVRPRPLGLAAAVSLLASLAFSASAIADTVTTGSDLPNQVPYGYQAPENDGLGVQPGQIKHVWVIVLENKAFNASFTPLEGTQGQYLSKLPAQGALLTQYYGTGHSSLDNYLSMVSGQAPLTDTESDCPAYTQMSGSYDNTPGTANYGQFVSGAGANAPAGDNGCVYPATVPTVFNQLNKSNVSWKLYAQDVGNSDGSYDSGTPNNPINQTPTADCAGAAATVGPAPSPTQTSNPDAKATSPYYVNGSANPSDQYVAKHNPLPWFESLMPASEGGTGGETCAHHLVGLFGPNDQLYKDLQSPASTPEFNYIVPDNCSNGHDAVCAGNNLSGMEAHATTASTIPAPVNLHGWHLLGKQVPLHSHPRDRDVARVPGQRLDRRHVRRGVPALHLAEQLRELDAAAFDGIRVADHRSGGRDALRPLGQLGAGGPEPAGRDRGHRPGARLRARWWREPRSPDGDAGRYHWPTRWLLQRERREPTATSRHRRVCLIWPDRPSGRQLPRASRSTTGSSVVSYVVPSSASTPTLKNEGQQVTFNGTVSLLDGGNAYTGAVYVGDVTDTAQNASASSASNPRGAVDAGAFQLVDGSGNPVIVSGGYSGTLALAALTQGTDPYYDAYDPTLGGGDAGAVLISPYIKPGTVSNTYYNHYSLLRSLEDIFQVRGTAPGIDGQGHLGFAAQKGLAPFGSDVFTNPAG